jgi:hypothetical protein
VLETGHLGLALTAYPEPPITLPGS